MDEKIIKKIHDMGINYQCNVSMKKRTWIHRGPIVPIFIIPQNKEELELVIRLLLESNLSYKVIGHTSNIYMQDTYKVDAVIATSQISSYSFNETTITCDTGVNISRLSKECVEKGYKGFEGLVGLPGTVGAAIVNNASCFKCAPSYMLLSATILTIEGHKIIKEQVTKDFFQFEHRSSSLKRHEKDAIVLDVTLRLDQTNNIKELKALADVYIQRRKDTQNGKAYNLGSIFSSRKPKPLGIMSLGVAKTPHVFALRFADHFFRGKRFYRLMRNGLLLRLYGYSDVIPYVSKKNINCFLWLDDGADAAFIRYQEFMYKCFDCGPLEIEILK